MKKLILVFLLYAAILHPQQFQSLEGIENQIGQTILLYRYGTSYFYCPVIKFNTSTNEEKYIMYGYRLYMPPSEAARSITDFEFFPGDENNFVNTVHMVYPDDYDIVARNDSQVADAPYSEFIDISKQDPNKVFVFGAGTLRSFDRGYTYPPDSAWLNAGFGGISLSDFDDNIIFGVNEELQFCRNAEVVDTSETFGMQYFKMLYESDTTHIYRINKTWAGWVFSVSDKKGDAFSWSRTYQSDNPFYIAKDGSPGIVFIADQNIIYRSVNFGYTFAPYRTLPYKINGLYKKPTADELYASTLNRIYKITPDAVTVIKSAPLDNDEYTWFPMAVGNRWVYNVNNLDGNCWMSDSTNTEVSAITRDTLISDNTWYIFEPSLAGIYRYLRIDTLEGKLKTLIIYPDAHNNAERTIYDFAMQPGDTMQFEDAPYAGYYLYDEDSVSVFNENWKIRNLIAFAFLPPSYSLIKGIGFYRNYFCEFGGFTRTLKGCFINGVVYGDTVTSANDIQDILPGTFTLYPNYPNPFNPVTKIKYDVPATAFISINIYDILGSRIAELVNENKSPGTYEIIFNGSGLPSGIYFCKMRAGNFMMVRKLNLLK